MFIQKSTVLPTKKLADVRATCSNRTYLYIASHVPGLRSMRMLNHYIIGNLWCQSIFLIFFSAYLSEISILQSRNPSGGSVGPAKVRSHCSKIRGISSGCVLPVPTSKSVPATILTILYKKPFPSI